MEKIKKTINEIAGQLLVFMVITLPLGLALGNAFLTILLLSFL